MTPVAAHSLSIRPVVAAADGPIVVTPLRSNLGTAASIALSAHVQPSTLVRFAQHFGFDGFSGLQQLFRARLRERTSSYEERLRSLEANSPALAESTTIFNGFITAAHRSIDAIAAAAGIDQARGDQLSVQTLTFDRTYLEEQTEDIAAAERTQLIVLIAQIVGGLLLLAALFWYISRLLRNLKVASVDVWEPVLKPSVEMGLPIGAGSAGGMELASGQKPAAGLSAATAAKSSNLLQEATARIKPKVTSVEEQKMQQLITRLADDNPASVADVIQMWLNQDKKND